MDNDALAVPPIYVRAGFERVMAGVDIDDGHKEDIYDGWLPAMRSGDRRKEEKVLFLLLGHFFRWPTLDAAAERFEGGAWPQAWDGLIDKPYRPRDINPSAMLGLLRGDLWVASTVAMQLAHALDPSVVQVYRLGLATELPDCPVEMGLISLHGRALELGDYSTLPPFFPGNRTYLRTIARRRTR